MLVVKARTADAWHSVPKQPIGKRVVEKELVRALEQGTWAVNHEPVQVFPGLVVSFLEAEEARFFLDRPQRAERVQVDAGELVAFHEDADGMHFVKLGDAEPVSEDEAKKFVDAAQSGATSGNVHTLTGGKRVAR